MRIFVTGGGGYIGSHVVKALGQSGHEALTYDNFSSGRREAVLYGGIVPADIADTASLRAAMTGFKPDAVMHFAALIVVPESVGDPLKYYINNAANTMNLLSVMRQCGVGKFIFSSTAAVYGEPSIVPLTEDLPLAPASPYGVSKMITELLLRDMSIAHGDFRYVSLRYFNAAGADPESRIGECHEPETHLIPLVIDAALGIRPEAKMFGTDYPTADGTCIRDYIHVEDLAHAHLKALDYLMQGGKSDVFNCGYGHGYSVREIIDAVKRITDKQFKIVESPRRPGDPPRLIASNEKIKSILDWRPRFDNLDDIVRHACGWSRKYRNK